MDNAAGPSNVSVMKHKRGKPLTSGERLLLVFKVFNELNEKYPTFAIKDLKKKLLQNLMIF